MIERVRDTVDNIPGVAKVGPKTALKWLGLHGSLDGVIANAASIGGAVGENLRNALDWLPQGRALVTVKLDCDLSAHMVSIQETLVGQPEDADKLREFFQRYGFKTMLRELSGSAPCRPSHLRAVFGPTFATPGILSTVSPISVR